MQGMRDATRLVKIVRIAARLGLGKLFSDLETKWHWKIYARFKTNPEQNLPLKVREAFEELGGGFLKLGQLLSLRPDLVPQEYCVEFQKLQDHVSALPFSIIREVLKRGLPSYSKVLTEIDERPLGSASVAQVHRAKLVTGQEVIVKVLRPQVKEELMSDIAIMRSIAHRLENHYKGAYPFTSIVDEFERYTAHELDFRNEAESIQSFHEYFKDDHHIVIPEVFLAFCSDTVMVASYLDGRKLSRVNVHDASTHAPFVAMHLLEGFTKMVFDLGAFHADLHPGNILLLPKGKIGLIDFGIVGNLSPEQRHLGIDLIMGISRKDPDKVTRTLLRIGTPSHQTHTLLFKQHVRTVLGHAHKNQRMTHVLHKLLDCAVRNGIAMPKDVVLLGKAAVTIEGTCMFLDSHADFEEQIHQAITRLGHDNALKHGRERIHHRLSQLKSFTEDLSDSLEGLGERIRAGSFKLDIEDLEIKSLGKNVSRSGNQLVCALLIAAFLIAGAMLAQVGPQLYTLSIGSWIAFLFATLLLVVLLVSILREPSTREEVA